MTTKELIDKAIPCPFCGEKPVFDYGYVPAFIEFMCLNNECNVNPHLSLPVTCTPWDDTNTTFRPEFEQHHQELLDKWNKRSNKTE